MTIKNQQYFQNTRFVSSVFDIKKIPNNIDKEVVFAGRSNCGKSSIINSVTKKRTLAIVGKTPGRTQSINYFAIQDNTYLVDLPGYGYAKVTNSVKLFWGRLIEQYFISRKHLKGVVLIMDIRHPMQEFDEQMLLFCKHHHLPVHIVLNKSDKISKQQSLLTLKKTQIELAAWPFSSAQTFSTTQSTGLEELQNKIIEWLEFRN